MVETFTHGSQTNAKRLRHDMYAAYAQHLNDFTAFMKSNGVDLYAISIQNEPDYASTWTWWTASEIVTFLRNNAGSISTRVIAPESFQYVKSMSDPILNDPTALANMDILGAHLYGTAFSNFPYPLFQQKGQGKELWMTEVYYPNSTDSADLWPAASASGNTCTTRWWTPNSRRTCGGTSGAATAPCARTGRSASGAPSWRTSRNSSAPDTCASTRPPTPRPTSTPRPTPVAPRWSSWP